MRRWWLELNGRSLKCELFFPVFQTQIDEIVSRDLCFGFAQLYSFPTGREDEGAASGRGERDETHKFVSCFVRRSI